MDIEEASQRATKAVAEAFGIEPSAVQVEPHDGPETPGVAVLRASYDDMGRYIMVVVTPDDVLMKPPATMEAVIAAWGYGTERTVSAQDFAAVIGALETQYEPGAPILHQSDYEHTRDDWKSHLFVPREATIDGQPAVEYWMQAGEPPLWRSTMIIGADGKVTHRYQEIWDF